VPAKAVDDLPRVLHKQVRDSDVVLVRAVRIRGDLDPNGRNLMRREQHRADLLDGRAPGHVGDVEHLERLVQVRADLVVHMHISVREPRDAPFV
jgi:hypothetical protein